MEENIDNEKNELNELYKASDKSLKSAKTILRVIFVISTIAEIIYAYAYFRYNSTFDDLSKAIGILLSIPCILIVNIFLYKVAKIYVWYLFDVKVIRTMLTTKTLSDDLKDCDKPAFLSHYTPPNDNYNPPTDYPY